MDEKPILVGFVGLGNSLDLSWRAITPTTVPGLRIAALCHPDLAKAQKRAAELGIQAFASVDAMVRSGIPAVMVGTPSGAHAAPVIEALRAGADVNVEKPIDVTSRAIQSILDAERETGKNVSCMFQNWFSSAWQRIRQAVKDGRLGKLVAVRGEVPWYRNKKYYRDRPWRGTWELDGGGALMNQAIHQLHLELELVQLFLGADPKTVPAHSMRGSVQNVIHEGIIETEDRANLEMEFQGGPLLTLYATTAAAPGGNWRIVVEGERGTLEISEGLLSGWSLSETEDDRSNRDEVERNSVVLLRKKNACDGGNPLAIDDSPRHALLNAWHAQMTGKSAFPIPAAHGAVPVHVANQFYDLTEARTKLPKRAAS